MGAVTIGRVPGAALSEGDRLTLAAADAPYRPPGAGDVATPCQVCGRTTFVRPDLLGAPGAVTCVVDLARPHAGPAALAEAELARRGRAMADQAAALALVAAWRRAGRRPDVHARAVAELGRTWPALAQAVEAQVAALERRGARATRHRR